MALGTLTASHKNFSKPAQGSVKIYANSPVIVDTAGKVVYSGPIVADIVDGEVSVGGLVPTDAVGYEPATGRRYTIVTRLNHTNSVPTLTDVELKDGELWDWADLVSGVATTPVWSPWFTEEMLSEILDRLAAVEQDGGSGGGSYDDTQIRADYATADATVLAAAKAYADALGVDLSALVAAAEESGDIAELAAAVEALAARPADVTQAELDAETLARQQGDQALTQALAGKQPTGSYATTADVSTASTADRQRSNHVGTQPVSTIDGLQAALDAKETPAGAQSKVDAASTADRDRTNHIGTQSLDTTTDSATRLALTATERNKLAGVATGATANATDAQLRDRATHTGTQSATSITGLATVATTGSKADVGLGNVDNTSDVNKPLSTATQNALASKITTPSGGADGQALVKAGAGYAWAAINPTAATRALGVLRAGLAARSTPCRIVFAGSSTTAGQAATAAAARYVNRLVATIQAAYPSGTGSETATQASTSATFSPSSAAGVQGFNAGEGGTTAATYLTSAERTSVAALSPSAVVHMIGSNDFRNSVPVADYKANVLAAVNDLKTKFTRPCVQVLVHSYERSDFTPTVPWSLYGQALAEIAAADPDNVVFVDISHAYRLTGQPGSDPLNLIDTDNVHQTDLGHALMADLLRDFLGFPANPTNPATPPATGAIATDSFNRADNTSLGNTETGGFTWAPASNDQWSISSNRAALTVLGAGVVALPVATSNVALEAVMRVPSSGTAGLGVRTTAAGSTAGANSRLTAYFDSAGNLSLAKVVNGALSQLATAYGSGIAAGTDVTLKLAVSGATLTATLNGVVRHSVTLDQTTLDQFASLNQIALRSSAVGNTAFDSVTITAA